MEGYLSATSYSDAANAVLASTPRLHYVAELKKRVNEINSWFETRVKQWNLALGSKFVVDVVVKEL